MSRAAPVVDLLTSTPHAQPPARQPGSDRHRDDGHHTTDTDRRSITYRADIDGLRAVAIGLVVLYHFAFPGLTGGYVGVDVFFVISGYLITGQLVCELRRRGTISIVDFYCRRILRLMPAAILVITVTLLATWIWLPLRLQRTGTDALAAVFCGMNLHLIDQSVEYFAPATPSLLEHYWSLAVEEQFYLVWPPLLLTISMVPRFLRITWRVATLSTLTAGAALSFAFCLWQTQTSQPSAYFGPVTRAWELAVGALLSLLAPTFARVPRSAATTATCAGLAMIVFSACALDEKTRFPGAWALLPVAGAVAVIAGGNAHHDTAMGRLLAWRPLQILGRLSYSWYLWHWPILVILPIVRNHSLNGWERLAAASGSLVIAALSYHFVENPVRRARALRSRRRRAIALGVTLAAVAGAPGLATRLITFPITGPGKAVELSETLLNSADPAAALSGAIETSSALTKVPSNVRPAIRLVEQDIPRTYHNGCHLPLRETRPLQTCIYGDPMASTRIMLIGDSHAAHWLPALDIVAKTHRWQLHVATKSACTAANATVTSVTLKRPFTECDEWRSNVFDMTRSLRPDRVILSSTIEHELTLGRSTELDTAWAAAWRTSIDMLQSTGAKVSLILDTPHQSSTMLECVASHLSHVDVCHQQRTEAILLPTRSMRIAEASARAGAQVIDPTNWFCTPTVCPVIVGNLFVYRDPGHIATEYSALLAPLLGRALAGDTAATGAN